MAKYEVELSDMAAAMLLQAYGDIVIIEPDTQIDPKAVNLRLACLVSSYGRLPRIADKMDEAAMSLVRAKAMEHAVSISSEQGDVAWTADRVLSWMLEERRK